MGSRRSRGSAWVLLFLAPTLSITACQTDPLGAVSDRDSDGAVDTGNDQIVAGSSKVALIGAFSSDGDQAGQSVEYRWRQISGTPVEIADATSSITSFIAPAITEAPEMLTFELEVTVNDSSFAASHEVTVLVASEQGMDGSQIQPSTDVSPVSIEAIDNGLDSPPRGSGFTVETDGDMTVVAGDFARLEARMSSPQAAWRVQWRQIGGNPVELFDPDALTASFFAPPGRATLLFRVTGYMDDAVRSADVTVHVGPVSQPVK